MNEWKIMFGQVQNVTRSNQSLQQSLRQVITFAQKNPALFDEQEYWNRAQGHDFQSAFVALTEWAGEGLVALEPREGWQFLLLDLGDCPETFRLYSPGGQELMSEQQFRDILVSRLIVDSSDMEGCFSLGTPNPFGQLFGVPTKLSDHHVSELGDTLLDWTDNPEADFHGNNGYLLWLTLGSLALVKLFRDRDYCQAILRGRDKIYLLSGYEEIFFYAATVTPEGILFETA